MAFVLPGNSRQLRFTGEVRAQAPAKPESAAGAGALALGKPRVRKPPPPPPAARARTAPPGFPPTQVSPSTPERRIATPERRIATPVSGRDLHRSEALPSPYTGATSPPIVRSREDDYDDEQPTMAMDRDGLDVLPGARALRTPKPSPAAGAAPIPHFRPAAPASREALLIPGTASSKVERTSGAPLAVWIVAGLLAGIVSYHVAPEIVARLDPPAHTR